MSDFTVYANITDRYEIAWEDIAADCVPEGKPEPGETYGKCIVRFRYQGSDPEIRAYAEENGISAEIPLYLRGDCDLNGITDVADAQKALKTYVILLSGLKEDGLQDIQRAVMDVDRNGVTELEDAAYILQYYTKSMAGLNPDWKTIMKQN